MKSNFLIALDWGTSNLRATLLASNGAAIETRSSPGGIMAVKDGGFKSALMSLCGDWLAQHDCPLIASGMIGSRQGWKEAPYLDCPADADQAASQLTTIEIHDIGEVTGNPFRLLHIVPGLRYEEVHGQFDVMRGEETQVWGAGLEAGSVCVLPGTHSKWVWTGQRSEIVRFRTYMTGELYGLLTTHGILGRLMKFGHHDQDAFVAGARLGMENHAHASNVMFMARTAGLTGLVSATGLPDYLSGILIGIELGSAMCLSPDGPIGRVTLIGDDDLCHRYELALELKKCTTSRACSSATTLGQTRIAQAAKLLGASS